MENQILETISPIKNLSKKSPTAEISLNHVSKTSASNIDLSFVNEITKQLIAKNKINDNFKIVEEPEHGNLNQSIDEAQALLDGKLNEILGGSPHYTLIGKRKIIRNTNNGTITSLNRKNKKSGLEEVFKLVKDSLATGFTRENFNECLGEFISKTQ